ncbi:LytR C-terminal domain-containing protein [Patescibacteria group bacterium]|nr:LytR C-terminal domain-containing protein [Patescibacteria group bacterium]
MPRKTQASEPSEDSETKTTKPKRKTTRKKKEGEPDLSVLPGGADETGHGIDSVAKPVSADSLHGRSPIFDEEEQHDKMRDIKPREFHRDATFLVPEKFGFDLKNGVPGRKKRSGWSKLAYVLIVLIIIFLAGLYALNKYSGKLTQNTSENVAMPGGSGSQQTQGYTLGLSSVPDALKAPLQSLLSAQYTSNFNVVDSAAQLPQVTADTLFIKSEGVTQNNDLLAFLATNGIKAQLQQVDNLPQDAVLYLTPTVASPDLSTLTAAVYNATSTTGLAKKNCDILTKYKVTSCNALNATQPQTGTTVSYKQLKALFILKRTPEYQNATFNPAPSSQVEDISITIGK